jgi:signal transduction histidine kinase
LRVRAVAQSIRTRAEERADERVRIARDLHDTLLQGIQGLLLNVHVAAQKLSGGESKLILERALSTADQIVIEGRNRVSSLRVEHLTDADLVASIESVAHQLATPQAGVNFQIRRVGGDATLHSHIADEIFHIVREALTNAFRHARAKRIEANLEYGRRYFRVLCEDDGVGFDERQSDTRGSHWGLVGMRERATRLGGNFDCDSKRGGGTCIRVAIPSYRAYQNASRLMFHLRALSRCRRASKIGEIERSQSRI